MKLGLRIDVDTFRGTRDGLPVIRRALAARGIRGTFFLTVGPDNMGRHLRRLVRPSFMLKMLRSRAASTYGWDILFKGTMWPGPVIHRRLGAEIRGISDDGHEIGTHAWDHHHWQTAGHRISADALRAHMRRAHDAIADSIGRPPTCAAAPGWRCTEDMLASREGLGYAFASDCRGHGVFQPSIGPPQVCANLPTWDEAVGRDGVDDSTWNAHVRSCMREDDLDVLTVHAEVEGGRGAAMFGALLDMLVAEGVEVVPLGDLLPAGELDPGRIVRGSIPGREGWLGVRGAAA